MILMALSANVAGQNKQPIFKNTTGQWADSVFKSMSLEEKIGQLFMVAAYSNKDAKHEQELENLIKKNHIGGLIFFQGGPERQAHMQNRLQAAAKTPLWIGVDAEWGLSMRLDSTITFPRQMTLGAIQNDSLIYAFGVQVAKEFKRIGAHINFAPAVDINNNSANPVIGSRSFGENKLWVTRKAAAYMEGMQNNGIMATAKHFPGHGDTDTDSHHTLPIIKHNRDRIINLELYPYTRLFDKGLSSVMVAHLSVKAFDTIPNHPSTLSPQIITDLLKNELGFKGIVFTDAMNMRGLADYLAPGEVDVKALQAGNDVLLFPMDVPKAVQKIKQAIADGEYSEDQLNESVKKILQAKEWAGLNAYKPVKTKNLISDLNTAEALHLKKKLCEAAITLVQNTNAVVPLKNLDERKITVLTIGGNGTVFKNRLAKYTTFNAIEASSTPTAAEMKAIREKLKGQNTLIVNIEGTNNRPGRNFGLSPAAISFAEALALDYETIFVHQGSPYSLEKMSYPERFAAILVSYQDDAYLSRAAAEALMGAIQVSGKLPVSIGHFFPAQTGVEIAEATRLKFTTPMDLGLKPDAFAKIDSMVMEGIKKRAYPGAQVLVAKNGKVVYNKAFGAHTYEDSEPVLITDIYDLASITKIAATTISLMKLDEEGKFDLDAPLHNYFPEIQMGSPYYNMIPRRMLAHVAGLTSWVPFYKATLINGEPKWEIYSKTKSDLYSRQVSERMFINYKYSDSLLVKLLETPLRSNNDYKYSDNAFYFMREIVKRQSGLRLDSFAFQNFYAPLGLSTMGFLPAERFPKDRLIPTEYDTYFRKELVHGFVHDPGAAMQGGVGGHAGLFSNAEDLAVLMQMLVNKGTYGGERYLKESTVEEYTRCQFCEDEKDVNRRGAGFDKPVIPPGPGPTCKCVDFESYGHTGFTGTITWADPVENIVYVFLSNRVYPTAENNRLARLDIRTNIQEEFYRVLSSTHIDTALVAPFGVGIH